MLLRHGPAGNEKRPPKIFIKTRLGRKIPITQHGLINHPRMRSERLVLIRRGVWTKDFHVEFSLIVESFSYILGTIMAFIRIELLSILLVLLLEGSYGYFITIDAHAEECFHDQVTSGTKMGLIFEVAEGGFLDIDVTVNNVF